MRRYSDGRETRLVVALSISFRQPLSGQMIDGTRGVLPCTAFLSYYTSRARSKGEESRAKNMRRRSEGVGGVGGGQEVAAPIEVTVCEKNQKW